MRRERSIDPSWFEDLFREDADPWNFESSPYERAKYRHTLDALPCVRFSAALEVGCANGILTQQLAARCDRLLAVDVSGTALAAARRRCADLPNVTFEERKMPAEAPEGPFDFVLLSEVVYYWDDADLTRLAQFLAFSVRAGGHVLLVHWTGETDYPKSGDDAVRDLGRLLGGRIAVCIEERRNRYRLDLWRRV
ncbi:nodulation protein S (NodS) [Novosphingobium sp. PhB165]|uniref:SAM-dependent methyltransferase n=1 Tax=Novosphingobium sp. PhB165 TaxID=2485105 RepID=UPI00104453D9|nr:SAM-dependent methyltransferase [Novosphingobium sp. PhB165]TCM14412.1 nodulation protein S (NodS) [Novosphingobium sp. PhB165]